MRGATLLIIGALVGCSGSVSVHSSPSPGAAVGPAWPVVQRWTFDGPNQTSPAFYLKAGQAWVAGDCVGQLQQRASFQLYALGTHARSSVLTGLITSAPGSYFAVDLGESYDITGSLLGDAKCTVTLRQR